MSDDLALMLLFAGVAFSPNGFTYKYKVFKISTSTLEIKTEMTTFGERK